MKNTILEIRQKLIWEIKNTILKINILIETSKTPFENQNSNLRKIKNTIL